MFTYTSLKKYLFSLLSNIKTFVLDQYILPCFFLFVSSQNKEWFFWFCYYFHQSKKHTSILLIFGRTDLTPFHSGQTFLVSFHLLSTTTCWDLGPLLLTELMELDQVCAPSFYFTFSVQPTDVLRDWDQDFVMDTPIPWLNLEVGLMSLPIWKTHLHQSFPVFRCCYNMSTWCSFLMGPSILWRHWPFCTKTGPQHDAATPVHKWDGVLRLPSFFLQKCT